MLKNIDFPCEVPVLAQLMHITTYPAHYHNDLQIILVLEGELDLCVSYTHYHLVKDSIHIIHSDDIHSLQCCTKDNLLLIVTLSMEYFSKFFPELDTMIFTTNINESTVTTKKQLTLRNLLFSILSEQTNKSRGYEIRIKELGTSLIKSLHLNFRGFRVQKEGYAFMHRTSHDLFQLDRISRIVSYMYQNYPYKISLSEIAKKESLSPYYLSHLFQKFVGCGFREFLNLIRVEMSEVLLLSSDLSISAIAHDIGFSNSKYYIEHFFTCFGCHPKEYRLQKSPFILGKQDPVFTHSSLQEISQVLQSNPPIHRELIVNIPSLHETIDLSAPITRNFSVPTLQHKCVDDDFVHLFIPKETFSTASFSYTYSQDIPQELCITILKEFLQEKTLAFSQVSLYDTTHHRNGLFTINGMRKPLFHFLLFLENFTSGLTVFGQNYCVSKAKGQIHILLFNDSKLLPLGCDLNFSHRSSSYQLTEERLISDQSCLFYWSQLNFTSFLTDSEKIKIERMSSPSVSFDYIPHNLSYHYSTTLAPFDITFLTLSPTHL